MVIPLLLGSQASLADRIRWAGLALQITGLCVVVIGLSESRKLFGKPSLLDAFLDFFRRHEPKKHVANLEGGKIKLSGSDIRGVVGTSDVNKRLDQLEEDVDAVLLAVRDADPKVRAAAVWALDEINPSRDR